MDTPAKFQEVLTHNGVCCEEDIDYLCDRYNRMPQKKLFPSMSPMPSKRGRRFCVLQIFQEGHRTVKTVGTFVTIRTVEKFVGIVGTVEAVEAGDTVKTVETVATAGKV